MEYITGELKDMDIEELAFVDVPGIGRKFVILKRGETVGKQKGTQEEVDKQHPDVEAEVVTEEVQTDEELQPVEKVNSQTEQPDNSQKAEVNEPQEKEVAIAEEETSMEKAAEIEEETEADVEKSQTQELPVTEQLEALETRLGDLDSNVTKILKAIESLKEVSKSERKAAIGKQQAEIEDKPKTVTDLRKELRHYAKVRFGLEE